MAANYASGDELIVGLFWEPEVIRGSWVLVSDSGRFRRDGDLWYDQYDGQPPVDIESIRRLVRATEPEDFVKKADVVVIAKAVSLRVAAIENPGQKSTGVGIQRVSVEEVLHGSVEADTIEFVAAYHGPMIADWAYPGPDPLMAGKEYCLLLCRSDGFYYACGGCNGVLQLEGNALLFRGKTPLTYGMRELRSVLEVEDAAGGRSP